MLYQEGSVTFFEKLPIALTNLGLVLLIAAAIAECENAYWAAKVAKTGVAMLLLAAIAWLFA